MEYVGRIREQVSAAGASDRVRFVGARENVLEIMKASYVLAAPILQEETFGNVALEARSVGLPVVTFARGGLTELVSHRGTGYVCASADLAGLLEGLRHFLAIRLSAPRRALTAWRRRRSRETTAPRPSSNAAGGPCSLRIAAARVRETITIAGKVSMTRQYLSRVGDTMKKLAVIAGLGVWLISGDWLLGLSTFVLALGWVFLPAEEGPPVLALAYTLQWVTVCVGLYDVAMTGRPLQATLGSDYQPMVLIGLGCLVAILAGLLCGQYLVSRCGPSRASDPLTR